MGKGLCSCSVKRFEVYEEIQHHVQLLVKSQSQSVKHGCLDSFFSTNACSFLTQYISQGDRCSVDVRMGRNS